ncbi:hypothetical protein Har1130_04540 [Haloarcula sp. CBA1130]|uniref:hypothetical protein n=1 Tax=unclassified Haloarcula TaxID=2624677 RepID=UPI0012491406|nr:MULTISPECIES: hypothetical protein [unclassified Haloarcula]KAA9398360.1 hypothetical protein Har1129_09120 [Haloarcula sp. CBA1129]KAA9402045.1 hypothetical protein Har1130_04540 [Haloarcula sp. CBA1130]
MYLGIDVHKRYAQVAVMVEAGEITEEVRVDSDQRNFWMYSLRWLVIQEVAKLSLWVSVVKI